jgi:hypothetical protein
MRTVENISAEEWEQIVDQFIEQEAEDLQLDALSAEQLFTTWEFIETLPPQPPTEIQIEVAGGHIRFLSEDTV